jgi:hypothetical protein
VLNQNVISKSAPQPLLSALTEHFPINLAFFQFPTTGWRSRYKMFNKLSSKFPSENSLLTVAVTFWLCFSFKSSENFSSQWNCDYHPYNHLSSAESMKKFFSRILDKNLWKLILFFRSLSDTYQKSCGLTT